MKVLQVTPSFYPAVRYGGPTRSVFELCRALGNDRDPQIELRVLTTNADGLEDTLDVRTDRDVEVAPGVQVRYAPRIGLHSISPSLVSQLTRAVAWADVVHLQAVFSFPTFPTLAAARLLDRPMVWSPRGAFRRWEGTRRTRLKDVWEATCRALVPRRLCLHATAEAEAHDSALRIPNREVVIIPNGVNTPDEAPTHERVAGVKLELLYLGRLDPIKGIDRLLRACAELDCDYRLTLAGTGDEAYERELRALADSLGIGQKLAWLGFVDGDRKTEAYATAHLVVVPSHSENFGIVIAEALAHARPVITTEGTPWARLADEGCGYWVAGDPPSIATALIAANSADLAAMGSRGRAWMMRDFTWQSVAMSMAEVYRRL